MVVILTPIVLMVVGIPGNRFFSPPHKTAGFATATCVRALCCAWVVPPVGLVKRMWPMPIVPWRHMTMRRCVPIVWVMYIWKSRKTMKIIATSILDDSNSPNLENW